MASGFQVLQTVVLKSGPCGGWRRNLKVSKSAVKAFNGYVLTTVLRNSGTNTTIGNLLLLSKAMLLFVKQ